MMDENTKDPQMAPVRGGETGSNTPLTGALLVICCLAGTGIIVLSFLTWMDIKFTEVVGEDTLTIVTHVKGTDASGVTTFGDGYVTAAFGAFAIVLAVVCRMASRWGFYAAAGIAVAGLCAAGIAFYNLAYDRASSGSSAFGISVQVDVARTAALWGLMALGIVVAGAAFLLLAVLWRRVSSDRAPEPEG